MQKEGYQWGERRGGYICSDHPMNDVQESRNAGLQDIWKRNEHIPLQVDVDGVIDNCGDLWKLIRSL
ncbi:hypothetical protein [Paenibacillus odorifer]|uniref:hypothetical protein n=1 Tax=Paenibacillus odorifer TaxID=189426 RepID=UPI0015C3B00B|nr:hypothetical protein [Paenibacillus odorifer]